MGGCILSSGSNLKVGVQNQGQSGNTSYDGLLEQSGGQLISKSNLTVFSGSSLSVFGQPLQPVL